MYCVYLALHSASMAIFLAMANCTMSALPSTEEVIDAIEALIESGQFTTIRMAKLTIVEIDDSKELQQRIVLYRLIGDEKNARLYERIYNNFAGQLRRRIDVNLQQLVDEMRICESDIDFYKNLMNQEKVERRQNMLIKIKETYDELANRAISINAFNKRVIESVMRVSGHLSLRLLVPFRRFR